MSQISLTEFQQLNLTQLLTTHVDTLPTAQLQGNSNNVGVGDETITPIADKNNRIGGRLLVKINDAKFDKIIDKIIDRRFDKTIDF